MSKARRPKLPLITPERLQRLSGKQFRAIQELVEAEDQRRFTAVVLRTEPSTALTAQEARTEHARLRAEERALQRQVDTITRRIPELWGRQNEITCAIRRLHVEPLIGAFVTITNPGSSAKRVEPKAGDIGRLLKVGRTHALIDFGEALRT